jgi:hypothetical protein
MVYAGPVLSHYEFEMPASTRKSDRDGGKIFGRKSPRLGLNGPPENLATNSILLRRKLTFTKSSRNHP